jgi:hypothetical protein
VEHYNWSIQVKEKIVSNGTFFDFVRQSQCRSEGAMIQLDDLGVTSLGWFAWCSAV